MKGFVRLISVVVVISIMIATLVSPVSAYTYNATKAQTISPSNKNFKNAKTPQYSRLIETINDSISTKYDVNIYHYRAPQSGEYLIYTEGKTDTVGRVYVGKLLGYSPVCNEKDDWAGSRRCTCINYYERLQLEAGKDYYICIRAYGSGTGSYTLHIEPYRDMANSSLGGYWYNNNRTTYSEGVYSVEYLTPEQCSFLYNFLSNQAIEKLIKNEWIRKGTTGVILQACEDGLMMASYADLLVGSFDLPIKLTPVSWLLSLCDLVLEEVCSYIYYDTGDEVELLYILQAYSGVTPVTVKTSLNGKTVYGTVYDCKNGIRIQRNVSVKTVTKTNAITGRAYSQLYENLYISSQMTYNSKTLFGGDFVRGCWVILSVENDNGDRESYAVNDEYVNIDDCYIFD